MNPLADSEASAASSLTRLWRTLAVGAAFSDMEERDVGLAWEDTALAIAVARVAGGMPNADASSDIFASTLFASLPLEREGPDLLGGGGAAGLLPVARFHQPPACVFHTVIL